MQSTIICDSDSKIKIFCADFDVNGSDPVREQSIPEYWRFEKTELVYKTFLSENDAIEHASNYDSLDYFDKADYIFDIFLVSYNISINQFTTFINDRDNTHLTVNSNSLNIELITLQHVNGNKENLRILNRRTLNKNLTSGNCKFCNGTKKLYLFTGFTDCDQCT